MLNFRSVADLNRAIAQNLWRLDRTKYDVVVGIPRSGMIPASLIATHLQLPLADATSYRHDLVFGRSGKLMAAGPRVLLVDDTSNNGHAMQRAVQMLGPRALKVTRLAIYGPYKGDNSIVDMFFEECPGPRAFQWNLWKHIRLERWGFDFDGVFCRDPSKEENDDGARYETFMATAPAMFMPQRPVGVVITCRLEKYRDDTLRQLARYGIIANQLIMMPYPTKAARQAAGNRGGWKAAKIKELGLEFFVESSPSQAKVIASNAQIPVWCTSTQELVQCSQ